MNIETRRLTEYGATSIISESEIIAAYSPPSLEARPCACGKVVIADRRDPTQGIQLHQSESNAHVRWRKRNGL